MSARPPVVLVPGMLCDGDLWAGVRDTLDVPVVEAEISRPSIGEMAEQVLDKVDGEFTVVGLSLGAIVGFEVIRRAPERVLGFCALSTNAAAPRPEQLSAWQRQAERVRDGDFDRVVRTEILPAMFASTEPDSRLADRFLAMAHRVGPDVFLAQLAAQATRVDAFPCLARAQCRTLVACGSADALCPVRFHRRIAETMRAASLRIVPGAGHLLPIERPHAVSGLLRDWLRAQVPSHC